MTSPDAALRWKHLARAALISLGIHFLAGLAMVFIHQRGLETAGETLERLSFLVNHRTVWVSGWCLWNLAALSILYFFHCLANMLDFHAPLNPMPRFAVCLTTAAVALDLAAEAIEMSVIPELARQALTEHQMFSDVVHDLDPRTFNTWHRAAVMLTGFGANGLYTFAAIILAWSGRELFPTWVWGAACGVGIGGGLLSLSALLDWVTGMVVANVIFLPVLLVWQAGVWRTAERHSRIATP